MAAHCNAVGDSPHRREEGLSNMSKDKAGKSAPVESHESHGSNGNGAKPAAPVVKADAKTLFRAYQVAQDRVGAAQLALEAAMVERSNAVQSIKEALGTGPSRTGGKPCR